MTILERDPHFAQLHAHLSEAAAGRGRLVFLGAEAGGGKTALIERFADSIRRATPVSVVSCDGLRMPGPFGPLFDIAEALGPQVKAVLDAQAPRDLMFRTVLAALRNATGANVLVGEDAHWTDEASLDLFRFLGRRIGSTRTLMIVTYRDDGLDPYHPLRRVLGDLVNEPAVSRISLPPLSAEAVRALAAGTGIDPVALHERTGGNPFYVTEIVATGDASVPATIRDAVLGRAAGISVDGRALLDAAAAIGVIVDPELLAAVAGAPIADALDECLAAGMLRPFDGEIAFRHGITRDVILTAMTPPRRRGLHRRILRIVEDDASFSVDLAHLAHHAEEGADRAAVLRYAPAAAKHAASFGAHRQAAAQYARTLRFAQGLPETDLADLLEARSYECYLTGQLDDAIADRTRAVGLRESLGDPRAFGDGLRWLSRFCWFAGRNAEAEHHARTALDVLEPLPPGPELAMACSNFSQLRMLAYDVPGAVRWGERAIELARTFDDRAVLAHALTNVGTALSVADGETGRGLIEQGARIARECGLHDDVARALANLAFTALEHGDLDAAERFIAEGLEFTADHDLIAMELYLRALRAQAFLSRGDWQRAGADARGACDHPSATVPTRIVALTTLGLVSARKGEDPWVPLDEALGLATTTGELMRLGPLRAARAEAAWLAGDPERAATEAEHEFGNAVRCGERWLAGSLALWLHRSGRGIADPSGLAEPFAHEVAGNVGEAVAHWRAHGYSLEGARALAQGGDEQSLREALAVFDRLGARPDAARTVQALRAAGARQIPRGPRPATRANVGQLTSRELEVLDRLSQGQSNREIAEALFLSPRTVGHHVSAILGKLGVSSRAEARAHVRALEPIQGRSPSSPN